MTAPRLTGEHAAHLSRTLAGARGTGVRSGLWRGQVRRGTVASVTDERVEFALGEEIAAGAAAPITLLLAVFKFDRMEWAIEKCTELNVTSIVPVIARRTEKHLALAAEKRVERWRRIAREASEQSRRVAPPEIADPMKLSAALDFAADLRIVLAESEREAQLSEILRARPEAQSLALAIGPEGGWAAGRIATLRQVGLDCGLAGRHHPAGGNGGYRSAGDGSGRNELADMNKRPISVTVLGYVLIAAGRIGIAYHFTEFKVHASERVSAGSAGAVHRDRRRSVPAAWQRLGALAGDRVDCLSSGDQYFSH